MFQIAPAVFDIEFNAIIPNIILLTCMDALQSTFTLTVSCESTW